MRGGASIFAGFPAVPITFGNWYHLVLTFDGASAKFYIDGTNQATLNATGFAPAATSDVHIGSGQGVGWDPFIGGVDEVAFYTNVLTATQVTNHYVVGLASFRPTTFPASIPTPPVAETNYSGLPVTFSVTAGGTAPFSYTWKTNGVATGVNANSLIFTPFYPGDNNDQITVIVSNGYGSATSAPVALTLLTNVNIIAPPTPITRNVGSHAAFHVTANGAVPITYQWSVSSNSGASFTPISLASNPTATGETLWLTNVQPAQSGNIYSVVASSPFIASTPQAASLTVVPRSDPAVSLKGYGAIIAADNPVAYWRFDEANGTLAEDAVGSFDGTYTPDTGTIAYGVTPGIPYSTDAGVTLAGDATIQVPWAPELNPDTAWSVETWLSPSSLSGNYLVVMSSQYNLYPNPYNGWYLYQQPTANNFIFVPQPGNGFIFASPNDPANNNQLVPGKWYHVVITDDLINWNIYINGVLVTSFPVSGVAFVPNGDGINLDGTGGLPSGEPGADGGNFVIGQRDDLQFGTFQGSVDDTAIYQYALSAQQVSLHYASSPLLQIAKSGSSAVLTWSAGVLQSTTNLSGGWTNVPAAVSPYTTATPKATFYRVHVP